MHMARMSTDRNFKLSPADWNEIFYALDQGSTGALTRIVEEQLTSDLTDADWIEIYIAVETKVNRMKSGFYGTDSLTRKWRKDLERILTKMNDIHSEYIGGQPCE